MGGLLYSNYSIISGHIGPNARGVNLMPGTGPLNKKGLGCFAATILLYPTPIGLNARGDDPNASHWPFMLGEGILMLVNGGQ